MEHLAASPQSSDLLTVESCCSCRGSNPDPRFALVVRSGSTAAARVLCLAGARGTGRMSLTVSIAEALGRAHVGMSLKRGDPSSMIFGDAAGPGRVVRSLARVQVKNPIFVLDALDAVDDDGAEPLLALLAPSLRTTFKDEFIDVPFDLSEVVWIATAVDRSAIPEVLRSYLEIVELPAYTEKEKLTVAEQHLLARPFDGSLPPPAATLAPDSAVPPVGAGTDPTPPSVQPVVLLDRLISGPAELAAFSAEPPSGDGPVEAWRTAASSGAVRFELDAIRRVIRDYTGEAGVGDLNRALARVCREVVRRRPAGFDGPDVVTPVVVAEILGTAPVDSLPPAVRADVAAERRRLSDGSSDTSKETNSWIEWLLHLPWTRRNNRRIDLAAVRAALDAAQAGLEHAKTSVMEYLAVRRRNPVGAGSVLCFLGPPGVGKTSLAQAVAQALGRGFAKVSCGGLRDETELRGHNRTWRSSQPGAILRELRRVGYRDPVFVFDEIDKIGPDPAAVLLEVFDPEQQSRFRDAFVELPFDLSEILFITTANDRHCIPGALRDRLEFIHLPGYTEADKVAIADAHLIPRENRAAGLISSPLVFEPDVLQKVIRDYTAEPGVRQLGRHLRSICRKVALGRETGDESLIRERITVEDVSGWLGADALAGDGLDPLRRQLDAPDLPEAVRSRSREVFKRLSGLVPGDPEYVRRSEYLRCLAALPWAGAAVPPIDRLQVRAKLDETHAGLGAVKDRIIESLAVGALRRSHMVPVFCLLGPPGVGKTSLARSLAAALGRASVCVDCQEISNAEALLGVPEDRSGRIVKELRGAGAGPPVFIFDEIDCLPDGGGAPEALLEVFASRTGGGFRDRYVDLPLDLSGALLVTTATRLDRVPRPLREHLLVVQMPGYTEAEQLAIADDSLLPVQIGLHGLPARAVRVTPDALRAGGAGVFAGPGAVAPDPGAHRVVRNRRPPPGRGRRVRGRDYAGRRRGGARFPRVFGDPGSGPPPAAGRQCRAGCEDRRRRRPCVVLRGRVHAGRRPLRRHRVGGRRDEGVGPARVLVAAGERRAVRPRPGVPPRNRCAPACAAVPGVAGRGVGRDRDGGRAGFGVHGASGRGRCGDDGGDHHLGGCAPGRCCQGEGAGGPAPGADARRPAGGYREAVRGARRGSPARTDRPLRDADRRVAGLGLASRSDAGAFRGPEVPARAPGAALLNLDSAVPPQGAPSRDRPRAGTPIYR